MKETMKWGLLVVLAVAVTAGGDEAEDLRHMARKLEERAEALLEQGRRAEALELLVRAHDLRAKADRGVPAKKPKKDKAAKKKAKKKAKRKGNHRAAATAALKMADQSLAGGMPDQAARHAREAMKHLARWQAQLERRERELRQRTAGGGDRALLERVERLEKEVRELRALLAPAKR